jgi:very-short-patch-repair endonuclease
VADAAGVSVTECLAEIGGVASRKTLVKLTSRLQVDQALEVGDIVADARGRYALPAADQALRAASRLQAVLSRSSAALALGWEVKLPPTKPHLTFPKGRKLSPAQRRGIHVHRADLGVDDVAGFGTSWRRTLIDCLRSLPFDEALAIADSALRHEAVSSGQLCLLAAGMRGPGAIQARAVAGHASPLAANPFESVLRALAIQAGLDVEPQVAVGGDSLLGRPDLVDVGRRIVLEADSFAWHGDRKALKHDARRYNSFVVAGWLVLRFCWEDVIHQPTLVLEVLMAAVRERTQTPICLGCRS